MWSCGYAEDWWWIGEVSVSVAIIGALLFGCAKKKPSKPGESQLWELKSRPPSGEEAEKTAKTKTTSEPMPKLVPATAAAKSSPASSKGKPGAALGRAKSSDVSITQRTNFTARMPSSEEQIDDGTLGAADSELSERELRKGRPCHPPAGFPELPPPDEDDDIHLKTAAGHRSPISFSKRGRMKVVPKDQLPPFGVVKSRQIFRPERRAHVHATLRQLGGWYIDKTAGPPVISPTGERVVSYVYRPPDPPPS